MKKVPTDVEAFAAKIADKQDNPTIHELAKAFPEKTYRELEKYRNEDREQEANQTPLTDAQKDLVEHLESAQIPLTESQQKQEELEPIPKGACIIGEARKDREESDWPPDGISFKEKYEKERKLRQEAEGETTIVKGIGQNSPEMKTLVSEIEALKQQLFVDREEADRSLANALEVNESHQKLNGKLQERVTELEEENKKMHDHLNKRIEAARKAGL